MTRDLSALGIVRPGQVYANLSAPHLVEAALARGEGLLTASKESLIEKLIVISSYRKNAPSAIGEKRSKIERTFSKFPATEIELTEVGKDDKGKYVPYR